MGDAEVQHQGYWTRRIGQIPGQLYVPTSLTPALGHLFGLNTVCGAKEVSDLINRPIVSFLGSRVCGTSAEVVP